MNNFVIFLSIPIFLFDIKEMFRILNCTRLFASCIRIYDSVLNVPLNRVTVIRWCARARKTSVLLHIASANAFDSKNTARARPTRRARRSIDHYHFAE